MTNDSINAILDDCTMSPKAYRHKYDCGQGIYDELTDYVPDMCIHLIGRTEAVMRHREGGEWRRGFDEGFASADDWLSQNDEAMAEHGWVRLPLDIGGEPLRVGDDVQQVTNWRCVGKLSGKVFRAILSDGGWTVEINDGLSIIDASPSKLRHSAMAPDEQCKAEIKHALELAASGDCFTTASAEAQAEQLFDMVSRCLKDKNSKAAERDEVVV